MTDDHRVPCETERLADRFDGDEHAELVWLRAENVLLRTERDILLQLAGEAMSIPMAGDEQAPRPGCPPM
ncbi:hypothetical protein EV191_11120 [Tamaricihabitans halophyticus]|uniref:Uncharacterized protein n=1 Tax=Tamaricihabitans halophyticus TaxID=1262583 RepID=A0A4R2QLD7_9PSEU|nr:hypothetical protein [Tamaricihabitans halophyticus]TCP47815.1 hypothetical protein EV191_11120 [Tamaricihabitans halophyticus]